MRARWAPQPRLAFMLRLPAAPACLPAVFAPSNQAFNTAVYSGRVSRQQLQVG